MFRVLGIVFLALVGLIIGLGATYLVAIDRIVPGLVRLGPWIFSPRLGSPEIDPYQRMTLFARGELPLASGEGFTLTATHDEMGLPLTDACRYRVSGPLPPARFWTLTLTNAMGALLVNDARRHGFTSAEILRQHDGTFAIVIDRQPQAGNWLPAAGGGSLVLKFRFYDPPLAASATLLDPRHLPRLQREACAS